MKVLKFGGSSVASAERISGVLDILKSYYKDGIKFTVVFSAFGGATDFLLEMSKLAASGDKSYLDKIVDFRKRHMDAAEKLLSGALLENTLNDLNENHDVLTGLLNGVFLVREVSVRTMDYVVSFGERNSAYIISKALEEQGIRADYLDARNVIRTDKTFGSAQVDFEVTNAQIVQYYKDRPAVQIATGFIGSCHEGITTTLGRGGSDYTAAIFGAALGAEVIEIWTDVNGVLTADPRKVKKAFTIPQMSYAEAMEMSHFGAKVIYPPTIQPALRKQVPIRIKNTFNPSFGGTLISADPGSNGHAVKGISSIGEIALLTLSGGGMFGVPGIAARLFSALAQAGINIILITQGSSEHSISFAIQPSFIEEAIVVVNEAFQTEIASGSVNEVKVEEELSVVAIIGENMRYQPGISGRLFHSLGRNGINAIAIAQGSSELNVSVVINKANETKALIALHEGFFLSNTKTLNVFMIGVGLIGGTLIQQLKNQLNDLKNKLSLEIKIIGLSNSKKMLFVEEGIDLDQWRNHLDASEVDASLSSFVERMKGLNLPNSIFIDNTANEDIVQFYADILDSSISISTPNKIATSSSYLEYQRLKKIASKRGAAFMYETNVGAGLPVMSTLRDMMRSGDRINKIQGVLSGSLSFIFNNFTQEKSFVDIVKQAQEKGYTEPDPRTDLSGSDVKRKLIILSREAGFELEPSDVDIKSMLPQSCIDAVSIDAFFDALKSNDKVFSEMIEKAQSSNKVLRMIATLDEGKATIGLEEVDDSSPFYNLSGSDNMIVITSQRYNERPLVIRGPGAGAEVTAAGVFAEIITIGNLALTS